jgi:SNF2 family DNA or RNA helicase
MDPPAFPDASPAAPPAAMSGGNRRNMGIQNDQPVLHPHIRKPHSRPVDAPVVPTADAACMRFDDTELKPHQERVVRFMMDSNERGMVLFHTVGSGKTITALAVARCLLKPGLKVVVATPASVKKQFAAELEKLGVPDVAERTTFVTHQGLATQYRSIVDRKTILIIDEAHNFKNMDGVRTQAAINASHVAYKVLLLTATPVTNKPKDLVPLIAMQQGIKAPRLIKQIEKSVKADDLTPFKCKFSYYITPMDVKNYPSFAERYVTVDMTPEYYARYLRVQQSMIPTNDADAALTSFQGKNLKVFMNGIRRAANVIGPETSPKVDYAIDRAATDVAQGKKVLIYSGFKGNGVHAIKRRLAERGVPVLHIDGSQTLAQRTKDVQKYNSGEVPVLLITLAGAEGLDLKGTRTVLLIDPWWNVSKIEQIVGRAVRFQSHIALPKAERHVDVLYLVLKKPEPLAPGDTMSLSADEVIYRMGEAKMEEIGAVYDEIHRNSIEKCPVAERKRKSA